MAYEPEMIWEMRSLKPRLKRVETWFQSEMNWENDLWLKCRFYEFDDFECGSAVLLWVEMAMYDYEYWLVLDWTVSRNGCVWLSILAGSGLNRKPDGWDGCWSMDENECMYMLNYW